MTLLFPALSQSLAFGSVSSNVDEYCDPANILILPLLFAAKIPSDGFNLEGHHFRFFGRERFRELYEDVCKLSFFQRRLFFLHGTLGAGKSHMLAALVCLLSKEGKKVVYLPDCRALLRHPFRYLQLALLRTFHDDPEASNSLMHYNTEDGLVLFCDTVAEDVRLYFIIDQLNALDVQDGAMDHNNNSKKASVRNTLDKITMLHLRICSSTGNYMNSRHDSTRQTGEQTMRVYTGLNNVRGFGIPYPCGHNFLTDYV